ncbi:cytochrome b/b6 domain-containing protein [Ruegeria sp.]|uniref:cytochrome b n=1 Tax=Ruegeria sp. TaxID=1879320 RepID=UPI002319B4EA|nr:cytochrome b/b6 domain-containing protein [Ruegeria sp.]MDA7963495.1 cytochrome b/b6 domain-containing protein [Ruegeria sp.]
MAHTDQSVTKYSAMARMLHWLMAAGFIFMWACGYYMTTWAGEDSPLQETLFDLHIWTGVTLGMLLIWRIVLLVISPRPPEPEGLTWMESKGSKVGHALLYILPALIITIGWLETDFGGHGVTWWGGIEMPKLFPTIESETLENLTATWHMWLAYIMLVVVIVHVAAVIKHRKEGHDVLPRMGIGNASETD